MDTAMVAATNVKFLPGYAFAITDPKPEKEKELQNQEKANKICRHIILSTLSNALFDVHCP